MDEISNPRSNGDYDNLCAHSVMILQTLGSILLKNKDVTRNVKVKYHKFKCWK